MAELNEVFGNKVIALYLPQFHRIPENDEWWGDGFTEWTNTRKAVPLFEGHYQPKIPLGNNYYDLSDVLVMQRQAQMAKEYGIYGFCYYHYWFRGGKKLLEKPLENMLKDKLVDIPFCLCWANENWSRNWDGGNSEILMQQKYGSVKEWEKHFQYLLNFFKDERYITYDGKPLLLIYKPEEIVELKKMMDYWQLRAMEEGFKGLIIIRQYPESYFEHSCDESRIDYTVKFQPITTFMKKYESTSKRTAVGSIKGVVKKLFMKFHLYSLIKKLRDGIRKTNQESLRVYDYDEIWSQILNHQPYEKKLINGAFVTWDNTARKSNGIVVKEDNPKKFEYYMGKLLKRESAMNIIILNAWNEWAEGAYLEPDEKYGYEYLEALKKAINGVGNGNES